MIVSQSSWDVTNPTRTYTQPTLIYSEQRGTFLLQQMNVKTFWHVLVLSAAHASFSTVEHQYHSEVTSGTHIWPERDFISSPMFKNKRLKLKRKHLCDWLWRRRLWSVSLRAGDIPKQPPSVSAHSCLLSFSTSLLPSYFLVDDDKW